MLDSQHALGAAGGSVPPYGRSTTKPAPPSILRATAPWLGVAAAIVLAGVWLRPRGSAGGDPARPTSAEGAPIAPRASSSAESASKPSPAALVDLDAALARATSKAKAWHRDAELVEIRVTDVIGGRIAPGSGAAIEMRFGTPPLGKRLGPGARVGTGQMLVLVDDRGDHTEQVRGPAARSVAPPGCGFDRAWHAMVASGVPPDQPVTLRFGLDKRGERAVWTAQPDGSREPTRTLDGSSCAVILRR
ncbi:MAG: hypothetical protein JW940_38055 [Polyangiaceae bacterium]|nr:hypothetical protein [Polyangiaceae bacterium]